MAQENIFSDVEFYSFKIPGYIISSTEGEFIELSKLIFEETINQNNFKLLPPKRAYIAFNNNKNSIVFPYLSLSIGITAPHLISDTFYYKKDFLFKFKNTTPVPYNKSKICITSGYVYDLQFLKDNNFEVIFNNSDVACLKMLKRKRVDYFLGEGFSVARAVQNNNITDIEVSTGPISSIPVRYAVSKSENGKKIIHHINKKLMSLKKSKELHKLFVNAQKISLKNLNITYDPISE